MRDRIDVVVQEVDLPAALELAQAGFAHDAGRVLRDEGLDREAPLGRGRDHRKIAQALERHRQRPRDRRRGQRQHVDLGTQPLQLLLLPHAEAVLLVDNHQSEALELHVALDQLVRADDEVDASAGKTLEHRLHLGCGTEARQFGELHRQVSEPVGERLEVLFDQQRGRHEHRDLLAVGHRDKCRAQGYLGLAETDVAANQPVHRLAGCQVADHRFDRGRLIGRLLEAEARGECLVFVQVVLECVPLPGCALRVEIQQLGRGVVRALGRLFLRLVPLAAAELVQRRGVGRCAAVAADQVQARYRHIELGVVGVQQVQEFVRTVAQIERRQAEVASDPVLLVHDRVADPHLGQIAQHRVDVAAPRLSLARPPHDTRIELGLGNQRDVRRRPDEPGMQRARHQRRARVASDEFGPVGDDCRLESIFGEILLHGFAAPETLRGDQHAFARGGHMALERAQRIIGPAVDLDRRQRKRGRRSA